MTEQHALSAVLMHNRLIGLRSQKVYKGYLRRLLPHQLHILISYNYKMVCSAAECACAQKSTCSCGKQAALKCNCEKAPVENAVPLSSEACPCGKRIKGQCTCGNSECAQREGEVDFTGAI